MISRVLCSLLLVGGLLTGCATKPKPGAEGTASASPSPTPAASQDPASSPAPTPTATPKPEKPKPTPKPEKPKPAAGTAKTPWYAYVSPAYWMSKIIPKKAKPPQARAPQLIGTIKMVNKDDRFVLIDAISYNSVQAGDALVCIVNQRQSANLRASALRNPPFLIADIASGTPSPGDKVYKQ
jgi:hypothetical protein